MPVLLDRIEPLGLDVLLWTGPVTIDEALKAVRAIDFAYRDLGCRWISYFSKNADLSDLDVPAILTLREALRPVVAGLAAKGRFEKVLISDSVFNLPFLDAWRVMAVTDHEYRSHPVLVTTIPAAAAALKLSEDDSRLLEVWLKKKASEVP